ncbi:hypothetical protein CLOSTHATH_01965 [Hungatella hathewayi DSM 13479]|uniref:Uncharacterized protein n=1 Tax=Hungatella hathewayi DSM 13479 TaxID=566550 RepID=D3AED4_9FIRM|nr:hypothetical protein CLOSTHATH_01965 [Hungatella hathewayi DSM 13479]
MAEAQRDRRRKEKRQYNREKRKELHVVRRLLSSFPLLDSAITAGFMHIEL